MVMVMAQTQNESTVLTETWNFLAAAAVSSAHHSAALVPPSHLCTNKNSHTVLSSLPITLSKCPSNKVFQHWYRSSTNISRATMWYGLNLATSLKTVLDKRTWLTICANMTTTDIIGSSQTTSAHTHARTHTQPFNGCWSGTTRVGQYQKKHSPRQQVIEQTNAE